MVKRFVAACLISFFLNSGIASQRTIESGEESDGSKGTQLISFTTNEGTEISVDVSPDGGTVVFDLLGQLYTLPIQGGVAMPLDHHQWSWDAKPRFAPDGTKIAFISDRGGVRDLWIYNIEEKKSTPFPYRDRPTFAPIDGTLHWMAGGREVVMMSGRTVDVEQRTERNLLTNGSEILSLAVAPNGQFGFFSTQRHLGVQSGKFIETRVFRINLNTNETVALTSPGAEYDEYKPELSRDGRLMAYLRQYHLGNTQLRIKDLEAGSDQLLTRLSGVDEPAQLRTDEETPGYAFTPDNRFIVIWNAGKIHKISVADGRSEIIPFTANVNRLINKPLRAVFPMRDGLVRLRALMWPSRSADEELTVFSAVGDLWKQRRSSKEPQRLTETDEFEFMPAISPNGKKLAFVTYSHTPSKILKETSRLQIMNLETGDFEKLPSTLEKCTQPSWSPDGKRLALVRKNPQPYSTSAELGWIEVGSPSFNKVADIPSDYGDVFDPNNQLHHLQTILWSQEGSELYIHEAKGNQLVLQAVSLDGSNRRELVRGRGNTPFKRGGDIFGFVPSPDLKQLAVFGADGQLYLKGMQKESARAQSVSLDMPELRRISEVGALYGNWLSASKFGYWFLDQQFLYDSATSKLKHLPQISIKLPRRQGRGLWAVKGARIISVSGDNGANPIFERGTIVVKNRRIIDVGPSENVVIPRKTKIIDGAGLTIVPGIIDVHYHQRGDTSNDTVSRLDRNLAYGVTTAFDPGGAPHSDAALAWQELIELGRIRGSRYLFDKGSGTGEIDIFEKQKSTPFEQVSAKVRQKRAMGVGPCLKVNNDADRFEVRMVVQAARSQGLCLVGHTDGAATFFSHVIDGVAPHHANGMPIHAYDDVAKFLIRSKATLSPHFSLTSSTSHHQGGFLRNHVEEMRNRLSPNEISKFEHFFGEQYRRREGNLPLFRFEDTRIASAAADAVRLMRRGMNIAISGDDYMATETRAEMTLFQKAGATPEEILRSVSITGARELGIHRDLGSLERGKIADFLVLTANPLENILNSIYVKWTVVDGVIYDSNTLEVVSKFVE